jgi:hypothetical protein
VPKPNYQFEKRQRELEKKKKKAEKALRKESSTDNNQTADTPATDATATDDPSKPSS